RKERQRPTVDRALDRRAVRNVLHEHPGDVTDSGLRRMPGDGRLLGGTGRSGTDEEERRGDDDGGPDHSGRCWRRNCSISATSSEAGGKSLGPGAAGGASSVSRDSSFLT